MVRSAAREDVCNINEIEKTTASSWSQSQIESEFKISGGLQLVAYHNHDGILGWCCARLLPPDAELCKITVAPPCKQKGVATALLTKLFSLCRDNKCNRMFLEVRRENSPAVQLYSKLGFAKLTLRKSYYAAPPDDAVVMVKSL